MIKILLPVLFSALFLGGCANETKEVKTEVKQVRFQSVLVKQATLLQDAKEKEACAICGMHLPTFYKTNHASDTIDGTKQYCSIHCLTKDNEINKTDLKNIRVIDTNALEFIPALKSFYVVGSKKPATMSRVSKYAFSTKNEALDFTKKFGGKVMKFYDAYDEATKDFMK